MPSIRWKVVKESPELAWVSRTALQASLVSIKSTSNFYYADAATKKNKKQGWEKKVASGKVRGIH